MKNLLCTLNLLSDKGPNFLIYRYYFAFEKNFQLQFVFSQYQGSADLLISPMIEKALVY